MKPDILRTGSVLAALLAFGLPAAFAGAPVTVLTLEQALQLGDQRNLDIARAREYQRYVQGRYVEERAAALPQLTFDASQMKAADETQAIFFPLLAESQTTRVAEISMTQALYTWGQVGAALRAAKSGIASAEDQLRLYRQATRRDVTAAFHDVLLARELAAIAHENVQQRERHLDEAKRRLQLGTATDYDVLAAQVDLDNARPAAIRTDNAVQSARDRLRFLLALGTDEVDVEGKLATDIAPVPAYEDSLRTALANRPDLSNQGHVKDVYKELVKIANAGDKPRLDFRGAYGEKRWDLGDLRSSGTTWNAGIYLRFPFFDGLRTRGRVAQARSDYSTQEIADQKLRQQVALEVRDALQNVQQAADIVHALGSTVAQAERLLRMAEKGFELGVKTKLEVDDAQLAWIQAKGNVARAQRDYIVSVVNLKYVTGTLD